MAAAAYLVAGDGNFPTRITSARHAATTCSCRRCSRDADRQGPDHRQLIGSYGLGWQNVRAEWHTVGARLIISAGSHVVRHPHSLEGLRPRARARRLFLAHENLMWRVHGFTYPELRPPPPPCPPSQPRPSIGANPRPIPASPSRPACCSGTPPPQSNTDPQD